MQIPTQCLKHSTSNFVLYAGPLYSGVLCHPVSHTPFSSPFRQQLSRMPTDGRTQVRGRDCAPACGGCPAACYPQCGCAIWPCEETSASVAILGTSTCGAARGEAEGWEGVPWAGCCCSACSRCSRGHGMGHGWCWCPCSDPCPAPGSVGVRDHAPADTGSYSDRLLQPLDAGDYSLQSPVSTGVPFPRPCALSVADLQLQGTALLVPDLSPSLCTTEVADAAGSGSGVPGGECCWAGALPALVDLHLTRHRVSRSRR